MLTFEHKMLMAQMIFNEKETLFGEFGPELTKVEKQEKWMEILVKLNSVGANLTDYKVSDNMQKVNEIQNWKLFCVKMIYLRKKSNKIIFTENFVFAGFT